MVQKKKSAAISSVSANIEAENSEKASEKKKQTPSGSSQNADKTTESRNKQLPNAKASASLPTSSDLNKEMLSILREMNSNITKQGDQLVKLSDRVDSFYADNGTDYQEEYFEQDDYYEPEAEDESLSHSQFSDENQPPPPKKQKTESLFKDWSDKFQTTEKVDNEVNEDLAHFVNSSFRSGVNDEKISEILKGIYRPSNCESLVKTRVNTAIWRLLKTNSQTEDSKMQAIQNLVIKASINLVKVLDKEGESLDSQSVEWGANAVALLGQCNKLINNKRKESHKTELDPKYHPLTSSSLPFTDYLYGDDVDVNKNVKDIRDLSKIARYSAQRTPYRGYNRRRGGRRGMTRPAGRVRTYSKYPESQSQSSYSVAAQSKNARGGHKK